MAYADQVIRRLCFLSAVMFFCFVTAWPPAARGHARSVSYSTWTLMPDGANVRVRISLLELSRLGVVNDGVADPRRVSKYLGENLLHLVDGEACPVRGAPREIAASEGWTRYEWKTSCSTSGETAIQSSILHAVAPSHLHFVRVRSPGQGLLERVLSDHDSVWKIPPSDPAGLEPQRDSGTSIRDYIRLGFEHILSGWDHLAFVFALILLAVSLGEVARLVTGFTIAHSVTLAMAVFGVLNPEAAAVEALIGFSIALVAAENTWLMSGRGVSIPLVVVVGLVAMSLISAIGPGEISSLALAGSALFAGCHFGLLAKVDRPAALRVAVAFAFGLIHGFGFAGVLSEMALPRERLVSALFGFNLGVEFGQIAVVVAIWPLLLWLQRWKSGRFYRLTAELGSAAICGLGLYWFVTRAFI
jgi:hypothetical protein